MQSVSDSEQEDWFLKLLVLAHLNEKTRQTKLTEFGLIVEQGG